MTIWIWRFPSAMHSGTVDGYNHQKLFVICNGCDHNDIAPWKVHIKSIAPDLVSLSLVMFCVPRQEWMRCGASHDDRRDAGRSSLP